MKQYIETLQKESASDDLNDEIRKYFLSYKGYPHVMDETEREIKKAIIYFANWQKQQMIDKACKWIRYNRWKYEDSKEGNEIMEKDFRKAMEEK